MKDKKVARAKDTPLRPKAVPAEGVLEESVPVEEGGGVVPALPAFLLAVPPEVLTVVFPEVLPEAPPEVLPAVLVEFFPVVGVEFFPVGLVVWFEEEPPVEGFFDDLHPMNLALPVTWP